MSAAKRVLIFALVLLVAGVGAIGVGLIPASGEAPKYECVTDGSVSSGFSDPDQGGCPSPLRAIRLVRSGRVKDGLVRAPIRFAKQRQVEWYSALLV